MEVYARVGGAWSCGSGVWLSDRLVVTAAHVVTDPDTPVSAIQLGPGSEAVRGRVVWSGREIGVDVALVEVADSGSAPVSRRHGVRWGRLVGTAPAVPCTGWGFPEVVASPDMRDVEQMSGRINPGRLAKAGLLSIGVDAPPERVKAQVTGGGSPWAGMSGAGVWCGELLVGVVVRDPAGFDGRRLAAVPVARLLADARFAGLVADAASRPAVVEPVELDGLFTSPPLPTSPALLLRADVAAVTFRGASRLTLLDDLQTWCERPTGFGVRLVVGPGGQGKSRLARELVERMRAAGWVAGAVRPLPDESAVIALGSLGVDVLLVVDYAEARGEQLLDLVNKLARSEHRVRMLLLARGAGEWRQEVAARDETLAPVADCPVDALGPVEPDPAGRQDLFHDAVRDLAARLPQVPGYGDAEWPTLAETVATRPPAELETSRFATVLAVQMGALASLLETAYPSVDKGRAEEVLLRHESRYWTTTATTGKVTLSPVTLPVVVAAAAVFGADTRDQAATIVEHLPGTRDQSEDQRAAIVRWLARLYPTDGGWWGALTPDVLAEYHITQILAEQPHLFDQAAGHADQGQWERALTVLTRAAATRPQLTPVLVGLIGLHSTLSLPIAIAVATEAADPQPVLQAIATTLGHIGEDDLELMLAVHDAIPQDTQVLRDTAAQITARLVHLYRTRSNTDPDAYLPHVAGSLNNLSNRLTGLGRWEEGLAAVQEAVEVYRELAAARPGAFLPDLAMSLSNLSIGLGNLGRWGEGLAAVEEAVDVYRRLAVARPDAFLPNLASSLNNLSNRLTGLGRWEEALTAVEEAVQIRRGLAAARPDAFLPDLASSLNNLSVGLGNLGRREEGLDAVQEAIDLYRGLAAARPDAFLPDLGLSLNNLSNRLADLGRREEGLVAIEEAVDVYRGLATARPDVFMPGLAGSLNNLSVGLGNLGRREEGLDAVQEAVRIRRGLATAQPDAFKPDLADSLNNLSIRLGDLGRRKEGLAAVQEAVRIRRGLATAQPDAFMPDLAGSLNNLSINLGDLGRREEGLAAVQEAVDLYRGLATAQPDAFKPGLAGSLNNLSIGLGNLGRWEEGLAAVQEAVDLYRGLATARPEAFTPDLVRSSFNLARALTNLGYHERARQILSEPATPTEPARDVTP
ncbi:tetratricopeptide repeat protein [Rugosimonospora acidiphila]|uniref:tetratricopeptide repeat protein n=1 Tax=Rugosimonospora acidiphila TaxID=556531 RepID=UPI0031E587F1